MRSDKDQAIKLRRSGKSYKEISEMLRVPPGTLSGWFGKEDWSKKIRKKLISAAQEKHVLRLRDLNTLRGENLERAYDEAREVARQEFELLRYNPLFIASMMLYWGEGDKANKYKVRLTNTDPEMHQLFYLFLKDVCNVPENKIGAHLLLYPDLDERKALQYWSSHIGISRDRFLKCTMIVGKHPTRRLENGICMLYVSSAYFKVKMLTWLTLLPRELIGRSYYENIEPEADIV